MLEKGQISQIQFTVLVTMHLIGSSILLLPSGLAVKAGQDAWLAAIVGIGLGLPLVILYNALGSSFPNMTLAEYSELILGKWLGRFISLFFSSYFLLISALVLRNIGDFLVTHILDDTPIEMIEILFLLVVIFGLYYGLETFSRTSELLFPIVVTFFILLIMLILPQIKMENIQPIYEGGIKPILNGALPYLGTPCMELLVFLMIFPFSKNTKNTKKAFLEGYLFGGIVLIVVSLVTILVFGPEETANVIYPTFLLATKIDVGGILQRMEALLAILWFITIFFKLTVCFYAANLCLAQTLKLKHHRFLYFPLGMLMLVLSLIAYPDSAFFLTVIGSIWTPFSAIFGLILPALLLIIGKLR
jgi:spore germination protein KB